MLNQVKALGLIHEFWAMVILVMVMHLYSAFSMWIYSNALYNTLSGTLPDCLMAQFTIFLM